MVTHDPLPLGVRAQLFLQLAQAEAAGLSFDHAAAVMQLPAAGRTRLAATRALIAHHELATAGERSGVFTRLESRLVRAATTAGSPESLYKRLADTYAARARQLAKLKVRLALPAIILVLAVMINPLAGLMTGSVTDLTFFFAAANPLIVVFLIASGTVWLLKRQVNARTPKSWVRAVPVAGRLVVRQNVRDWCESLALMLEAGVSMHEALPLAVDTASDPSMRHEFARIAMRVRGGAPLSRAMMGSPFLKDAATGDHAVAFVTTGESSGALPEMLMRLAATEAVAIEIRYEQLAEWAPRIIYGFALLWLALVIFALAMRTGWPPGEPPPPRFDPDAVSSHGRQFASASPSRDARRDPPSRPRRRGDEPRARRSHRRRAGAGPHRARRRDAYGAS